MKNVTTAKEAFEAARKLEMAPEPIFRSLNIKLPREVAFEKQMDEATSPKELGAAQDLSEAEIRKEYIELEQSFRGDSKDRSDVHTYVVSARLLQRLKTNLDRIYTSLAEQATDNGARWKLLEFGFEPFAGDSVARWAVHKVIINDPHASEEDKFGVLKASFGFGPEWFMEQMQAYNSILDRNPSRETLLKVLKEARDRKDWEPYQKGQGILEKQCLADLKKAASNQDRWKIFRDCWGYHNSLASHILNEIIENGLTQNDVLEFNGHAKGSGYITKDKLHEKFFVRKALELVD